MAILFLVLIFFAFISLGLPDSGFGLAWPYMRLNLGVALEAAGPINMIVTCCGAISSIVSIRLSKKISTGLIVSLSGLLTGLAMIGYSLTNNYYLILLCAIPLGFGAGGVDASLNNYVSQHYSSKIMNWLHASWGIGVTISPAIMTFALVQLKNYKYGFLSIALIQISLAILFFFSLKLWKRNDVVKTEDHVKKANLPTVTLKNLRTWLAILTFYFYCGAENSMMLWLGTFLVEFRGLDKILSGSIVVTYTAAIMLGRIFTGFVSVKIGNRKSVRSGLMMALVGIFLLFLRNEYIMMVAVFLIGFGFAPVYPSLMHETTNRFSEESSSVIVSYQMAAANIAMLSISPLLGLLGSKFTLELIIPYELLLVTLLLVTSEVLNKLTTYKKIEELENK
jgi:fucose permease